MATYTSNLNLIKPGGSDKIRIAQINGNMDTLDEKIGAVGNTSLQSQITGAKTNLAGLESAVGIVVDGAKAAVAASAGQYVVLKNSIISGCDDGLYIAAQAIPANTTINSTYLTAVSKGGLNSLSDQIGTLSSLTTTAKTNLVAAVNEVNGRTVPGSGFSFTRNTSTLGSSTVLCKRLGRICLFNINGIYTGSSTSGWTKLGTINITPNDTYYGTLTTASSSREARVTTGGEIQVYNSPGAGNDCFGQLVFVASS